MGEREARISVGVDGVEEIVSAARQATDAWSRAGTTVGSVFRQIGPAIGRELQRAGLEVVRLSTSIRTLDLRSAVDSFRQVREASTRFAVAAGTSVEGTRRQFESLARSTLETVPAVAQWATGVGRLTYNYQGALSSVRAYHREAIATGKSFDEMSGLAVVMAERLGVEDASSALGHLRAQAEALGTVGGVAAFQDQIKSLAGSMVGLAGVGDEARNRLTALAGVLGQGLRPVQAEAVQRSVLGFVEQRSGLLNLLGGRDIYDESGQLDPQKLTESLAWLRERHRRWIPNERLRRVFTRQAMGGGQVGALAAAAFERADFGEVARIAGLAPSGGAGDRLGQYLTSEHGRATAAERHADMRMRETAAPIARAQDEITEAGKDQPYAAQVGSGIVNTIATTLATIFGTAIAAKMLGRGGAAGAGQIAAGVGGRFALGEAGAVLGAGFGAGAAGLLMLGTAGGDTARLGARPGAGFEPIDEDDRREAGVQARVLSAERRRLREKNIGGFTARFLGTEVLGMGGSTVLGGGGTEGTERGFLARDLLALEERASKKAEAALPPKPLDPDKLPDDIARAVSRELRSSPLLVIETKPAPSPQPEEAEEGRN